MRCPRCQQENPPQAKFCLACASPVDGPPLQKSHADLEGELDRLQGEIEGLRRSLTEALEQQTATSEVLRVISQSRPDMEPVLMTVAERAARLCTANDALIFRREDDVLRPVARWGSVPTVMTRDTRLPIDPGIITGRAVIDARIVHIPDVQAVFDEFPDSKRYMGQTGVRTALAAPLLREGAAIGVILIRRLEVKPFTAGQIKLLETFADQAVIAIENVRLFTELEASNHELRESLEQQTATGNLLRVIASSPTDLGAVLESVIATAVQLARGEQGHIRRYDGEVLQMVAQFNESDEFIERMRTIPVRPSQESAVGRAFLTQRPIHIADVLADPDYRGPLIRAGGGTVLAVPMVRKGTAIGTISMWRSEVKPFTERQIELVTTFADQAVIAIENVRLFTELQARTAELTRSVEQLTALGEVGQAISSTLDLRTVLRTIVARATQLSGTDAGVIYEYDEQREVFVPRASEHLEAEIVEAMLATPVRKGEGATGRLAEVQEPIQLGDIQQVAPESRVRGALVRAGYRALLAVPLVRDDRLLGGLTVIRKTTGEFAPEIVELLRTFATQSALAIQNARLYLEIEDKSRQLEAASQHKSEFLANMSHELRTPLNAIIGFSEVLGERMFGELNEKQDEYLKDIYASGQHLLSLINDILDLSKIEAGRMELELKDFDLPQAIGNAVTLVRERAGRRGIVLHQAVDPRLGQIRGDERKIKQVLLNLLSNALKFTPEGGRVDVRATVAGDMAEVSVTDTGVGIAPEDQEAVFEEFRQVGTADKKMEGTGLGLALSRKFIELHGGEISVKSQVGSGSTFTFTLPLTIDGQR